jgi:hypothetical protein
MRYLDEVMFAVMIRGVVSSGSKSLGTCLFTC